MSMDYFTLFNVLIAILGILLIVLLAERIKKIESLIKLRKYRGKEAGFADLLNYAAVVENGIIVNKNGSFMAAWIYKCEDDSRSTEKYREQQSARINQALSSLNSGWMIHIDAVRSPSQVYSDPSQSHFTDPISKAIDDERRALFNELGNLYEGYFILTVTWFPPYLAQSKFIELMFDDNSEKLTTKQETTEVLTRFKNEVRNIESRLSTVFRMTRLQGHKITTEDGQLITHDDFLSWLNYCVCSENNPIRLPNNPMYIDALIGGKEFFGGITPKVKNKYIQVVAIDGMPIESTPGILNRLAELPVEYRWNSRFIFMDRHEAVQQLDKYRKKWRQKVRSFKDQLFQTNNGTIDQDALAMVNDAEAAIAELNSGFVAAGYYTSVIVLMDSNRELVEESARYIEKEISNFGFQARIETINTIEAYLGSLPGHGVENVRRPLINTLNLSDLIPSSTIWTGSEKAPCPYYPPNSPPLMHCVTDGSTPFRLNLHIRDLGHTLIFGPTRSGKSTKLALLALQLRRYKDMSIFAFDKGMSMFPTTKAIGGLHFHVASDDDELSFCPLQFLETRSDRAWAMEWIETILLLNNITLTPLQRNEIAHAIVSMYESGARTLSEFYTTIQDNEIRSALKQYTIDGMMGHLLDADEDSLKLSEFTCFEIEELMDLGDKFALPILLYLFRRIERSLTGNPTAIFVDEAWVMFGNIAFRDKLRDWLKTLAKKNCIVILSTQSISDAVSSGIFDVIVESTATKIYLPNLHATDDSAFEMYSKMGLNSRQIEIIASAIPKRQYYCVSEVGSRLYELALGPLALSFVGTTDKDSINLIKGMIAKFGEDQWKWRWLDSKGVDYQKYIPGNIRNRNNTNQYNYSEDLENA